MEPFQCFNETPVKPETKDLCENSSTSAQIAFDYQNEDTSNQIQIVANDKMNTFNQEKSEDSAKSVKNLPCQDRISKKQDNRTQSTSSHDSATSIEETINSIVNNLNKVENFEYPSGVSTIGKISPVLDIEGTINQKVNLNNGEISKKRRFSELKDADAKIVKKIKLDNEKTENTSTLTPPVIDCPTSSSTELPNTLTESPSTGSLTMTDNAETPIDAETKTWSATDDVALITAMSHVASLQLVCETVRFSKDYHYDDIKQRWYELLYNVKVSSESKKRISQLSPEQILFIQGRTPFTRREETVLVSTCLELLKSKGNISPTSLKIEDFHCILNRFKHTFHPARTAQLLSDHYRRIKCQGQSSHLTPDWEKIENSVNIPNGLIMDYQKPLKSLQSRSHAISKKSILLTSNVGMAAEKVPNSTIAMLRGTNIRYFLTNDSLVIGRSSPHQKVDVDLSIEGPASKISRRQALIEFDRTESKFKIRNIGQRAMFIDGKPLPPLITTSLKNDSIIEISSIRLVFKIVQKAIISKRARQTVALWAAKKRMNIQVPAQHGKHISTEGGASKYK